MRLKKRNSTLFEPIRLLATFVWHRQTQILQFPRKFFQVWHKNIFDSIFKRFFELRNLKTSFSQSAFLRPNRQMALLGIVIVIFSSILGPQEQASYLG